MSLQARRRGMPEAVARITESDRLTRVYLPSFIDALYTRAARRKSYKPTALTSAPEMADPRNAKTNFTGFMFFAHPCVP